MKVVADKLYLEFRDLLRVGVSEQTLKKANHYKRRTFTFMDDPADRRRVLIEWDTLAPKYQEKIKGHFGDPKEALKGQQLRGRLTNETGPIRQQLFAWRDQEGKALPAHKIDQLIELARWLRLIAELEALPLRGKRQLGFDDVPSIHKAAIEEAQRCGTKLPTSERRLRDKVRAFGRQGISALVGKTWGNSNAAKLTPQGKAWLLAQYCQPTVSLNLLHALYLEQAETGRWPAVTEQTVYNHLHERQVEQVWRLKRHGEKVWKKDYAYALQLRSASCRDAQWMADGTKLNFYYQDKKGMPCAAMDMYIVIDQHSEAIIGWSLGKEESHVVQTEAFKAALQLSGNRPYQILYDNQAGHKSAESQRLFSRIARVHFPSQAYNPQSKHVEGIIRRFQAQVMSKRWYYTGANITSRKADSHRDRTYVHANRSTLPKMEDLPQILAECVAEWNEMPHPKLGAKRMQAYCNSEVQEPMPLDILEWVEMFWRQAPKPITYQRSGLTLTIGDDERLYVVYDYKGLPERAFHDRYLKAKFRVKYDPAELSQVRLYDEEGRFVAIAEEARTVARAVIDLKDGERQYVEGHLQSRVQQQKRLLAILEAAQELGEYDPEDAVRRGYIAGEKISRPRVKMEELVESQPISKPLRGRKADPDWCPYDGPASCKPLTIPQRDEE